MLRSSAKTRTARRSSLDWTHTRGINGPIERTRSVSHANIARSIEERAPSNAKIISLNTFGIIITSAKTNSADTYLTASGVQRKSVLSQNLLPYPFTTPTQVSSCPRKDGSTTCELCTTNPIIPARSLAATASMEKATSVNPTYEPIFGRFMARMALSTRVFGTTYTSNSFLVTRLRHRLDAY